MGNGPVHVYRHSDLANEHSRATCSSPPPADGPFERTPPTRQTANVALAHVHCLKSGRRIAIKPPSRALPARDLPATSSRAPRANSDNELRTARHEGRSVGKGTDSSGYWAPCSVSCLKNVVAGPQWRRSTLKFGLQPWYRLRLRQLLVPDARLQQPRQDAITERACSQRGCSRK